MSSLFDPLTTVTLWQGDCLTEMGRIADGSVDAVICDPPYGTVKGMALDGWGKDKTEWDTAIDTLSLFEEYNRILRVNGVVVLFSQEPYTSKIITGAHKDIPFCYRMIWKKDHFANALLAKKAPVSYYEDIVVFSKSWDHLLLHPLREYAQKIRNLLGCSLSKIDSMLGNSRAQHFMRWDTSQFSLPSTSTYERLNRLCGSPDWWIAYEKLIEIDNKYSRTFNLPDGKKYMSNVLEFKKDYTGLHPTQKPVALMEYLIKTYTNPGDTVLDNTMGSGTTGVACRNTGRSFIGIEKDAKYFKIALERIGC